MYFAHGICVRIVLDCAEVAYVSEDSARFSTCCCVCVCPLALQWVTLEIEFHRSGSAGATRETCKLAALSGGWNQLEADARVQTPVSFAPCVRSSLVFALMLSYPRHLQLLSWSEVLYSCGPANVLQLQLRNRVRSHDDRLSQLLCLSSQAHCFCWPRDKETGFRTRQRFILSSSCSIFCFRNEWIP